MRYRVGWSLRHGVHCGISHAWRARVSRADVRGVRAGDAHPQRDPHRDGGAHQVKDGYRDAIAIKGGDGDTHPDTDGGGCV